MRLVRRYSLLLFPIFFFSVNVDAQQKIAHVNSQELWAAYPKAKAAQDSLANYIKQLNEQYETRKKDFQDWLEQAQRGCYSPEGIETIRTIARQKTVELEEIPIENELKIQEKEQALIAPVQQSITEAIQQITIEKKYTYIIDSEHILYTSERDDITPLVKTKLAI